MAYKCKYVEIVLLCVWFIDLHTYLYNKDKDKCDKETLYVFIILFLGLFLVVKG